MQRELQAIEDRENQKHLEGGLKGVYRAGVWEKTPRSRFIEFSKKGRTAELRMMATVDGEAYRTLRKREDGTVSDSWEPEPPERQSLSLHVHYDDRREKMVRETVRMLTAEALGDMGMARYASTCHGQHRGGIATMKGQAERMVLEKGSLCLMPSGERRVRWKDVYAEVNRLIRKHLLRPDARGLAETLSGNHRDITAAQYNRALRGGAGLWKLAQAEPGLAAVYFRHIMGPDDPERTTEDIAERVGEAWKLSGEELRALSRVAGRPTALDPRDTPGRARRRMTAQARALVITGAGPDSPEERGILQNPRTMEMMEQAGEEVFRKWLGILPGVLEEEQERRDRERSMGNRRSRHSFPVNRVHDRAEEMLRQESRPGEGQREIDPGEDHRESDPGESQPGGNPVQTRWEETRKMEKELEEMIREEEEKVTARLGRWTPLTVREGKNTILVEFMRGPRTPPLRSYRRRSDGTLEIGHNGRPSMTEKTHPYNRSQESLYTWVRGKIMEALGRRSGDPSRLIELTHPLRETAPSLHRKVELAAVQAVERAAGGREDLTAMEMKISWGQVEAPTVCKAADSADRIFVQRVIQEETSKLAERYTGEGDAPAGHTISAYNWAALNRGAIKGLERTAPGLAVYYGRLLLDSEQKPRRMHPGEMVRAVREDTGMDNREWKVFCRIGPDAFITRLDGNPMAEMEAVRENITGTCRAIADANQPRASGFRLRDIVYGGGDPAFFHGPGGERGERWRDWVHLLNRYLDPARDTPPGGERTDHEDLMRAVDTLRDHVERGLRWRRGSWEAVMRRTDEWHRAVLRGNWVPKDQLEAEWESPLGAFRQERITVAPVLTGRELTELGESMGNCLGSYIPHCVRGDVRIFTVSRGKKTLAAVEVARNGSTWQTGQVESPFRHDVDPEVLELAQELPRMYAQAEGAHRQSGQEEKPGR